MIYKRKKTDSNHVEIMKALRALGFSVRDLSAVGGGIPDLIISRSKMTYLVEVKSDRGKLNRLQSEFKAKWQGRIFVIKTVEDVEFISKNLP